MPTEKKQHEVFQDDMHDLLEYLDLGTHARPDSPHEVLQEEILPEIRELRQKAWKHDQWQDSLEWATDPPTEEGWYYQDRGWNVRVVRVEKSRAGNLCVVTDGPSKLVRCIDARWAGPLPEPTDQ